MSIEWNDKLIFGGHKSFSWGHRYPCFWLLVMSALGFKASVYLWLLCFGFLRFASGVTPADHLMMAAESFQLTYLQIMHPQAMVGVQTLDQRSLPQHRTLNHLATLCHYDSDCRHLDRSKEPFVFSKKNSLVSNWGGLNNCYCIKNNKSIKKKVSWMLSLHYSAKNSKLWEYSVQSWLNVTH